PGRTTRGQRQRIGRGAGRDGEDPHRSAEEFAKDLVHGFGPAIGTVRERHATIGGGEGGENFGTDGCGVIGFEVAHRDKLYRSAASGDVSNANPESGSASFSWYSSSFSCLLPGSHATGRSVNWRLSGGPCMKEHALTRRDALRSLTAAVAGVAALDWAAIARASHAARAAVSSGGPIEYTLLGAADVADVEALTSQIIPSDSTPG